MSNPTTLVHALDSRTGQQWTYDGGGEYRTLTWSVMLAVRPDSVWLDDGGKNHARLPLTLDAWELAESVAATLEKWGGKTTGTIDNDNATLPGVG